MATSTNSNSSGRLFVPITVDALVVNDATLKQVPFNRWLMDYDNLKRLESPMPEPFESVEIEPPAKGVHLHWALPDALTHGTELPGSDVIDFPTVPNRWMVVRTAPGDAPTAARSVKAWLLQSDLLSQADGTNPYLDPNAAAQGIIQPTQLGKCVPLDSWTGEPQTPQPFFLKALGPGDVTFAAFAPGVQNVFAFTDDMTLPDDKTPLTVPSALTYLIVGWFSDPTEDPLYGKSTFGSNGWTTSDQWQTLMDSLQWSVSGAVSTPPKQSLYHGMVYGVNWQNAQVPERVNLDPNTVSKNVRVAVGNTAIEALASLIENQANQAGQSGALEATLLEAFQYNLLSTMSQPGAQAQLDLQIRQAWFGSTPGGTHWEIVAAERDDLSKPQSPPSITSPQVTWLAQLNTEQRQLDQMRRDLASMQWELYALWWKHGVLQTGYQPQNRPDNFAAVTQQISAALDKNKTSPPSFINTVINLQNQITTLAQSLPDPSVPATISDYSDGVLDSTLVLKPSSMPRFYHPNDPVVVISGIGRAQKHGEDGRYSDDGSLLCRLPGQTITALTVNKQNVTETVMQSCIPVTANSHVPLEVNDVQIDAFFLDPSNAAIIAKQGLNATDPGTISAVSSAITDQQGFNAPPPVPFAAIAWRQAWSPLFLEWQLSWLPTVKQDDDGNWHFDFAGWQFDGKDYNWTGGNSPTDAAKSFKGRTFLTPQVAFNFGSQLNQYLQQYPNADLQNLENLLDQVAGWDLLSQTLSGLSSSLIMRDVEQNVPPDQSVANQVGDQYHAVPDIGAGDVDTSFGGAPPFFFPIRAGFLRFEKLQIVDCFGQALDLMWANDNPGGSADTFQPIRSDALSPGDNKALNEVDQLLIQPPRLVQPSRLDFRFVSADKDAVEIGLDADANPVCGWLLPNHLDRGVTVYDVQGQMLGEFLLRPTGQDTYTADWQSAPNGTSPVSGPEGIKNLHLQNILADLNNRQDKGTALKNFLEVIDETLWVVNPLGGRADQNMSTLIGRPLAVVRAKLQLTLGGQPVYDQSWGATFEQNSGDITTTTFYVRLGDLQLRDDGLMGYYDESQHVFYSVHYPEDLTPSSFIAQIGRDNYIPLQFNGDATAFITLLFDPLGSVHASTGILPTKTLTLPPWFFEDALAKMAVTFRAGPVLLDPGRIVMPKPAEQNGTWSWVQHTDTTNWSEGPIEQATQIASLADAPLTVSEGWLKLSVVQSGKTE